MHGKLHTIQYLRGIAALLVLASHALLYPVVDQVLFYGRLGWLGVILFFVVSGFIMVTVTGPGPFEAGKFLRRRVLRVVPMYWAFTLIAAALALAAPTLFKTTVFDGLQLALSLIFVPFYNPASHGLHPLYKLGWTLNYEMFFYICFAFLAPMMARKRVLVLTIAYMALAAFGAIRHPQAAIAAFYTSYLPLAFVAGAWLGLAHVEGRLEQMKGSTAVTLLIIGLLGLMEGFLWNHGLVEDEASFLCMLTAAGAAVAVAVGWEPKLPRIAVLERLGDASYSIYLVHIFAVALTAGVALHLLGTDNPWIVGAAVTFAMVGGIAGGLMIYRLVEAPLMRRLRPLAG